MYNESVSEGNAVTKNLPKFERIIDGFKEELSQLRENNYDLLNKVDKMVGCEPELAGEEKKGKVNENIINLINECINELKDQNDQFRSQLNRLGNIVG